jgi:hypothetical protein
LDFRLVKYTVNIPSDCFGLYPAPLYAEQISMEYKGVEYSVVQLTGDTGWQWEIRLGDGKTNPAQLR